MCTISIQYVESITEEEGELLYLHIVTSHRWQDYSWHAFGTMTTLDLLFIGAIKISEFRFTVSEGCPGIL